MKSIDKLNSRIKDNFHICVGLDTNIEKIPKHLLPGNDPIFEFNKVIIDSTIQYSAAYKLNFAFYEKNGLQGIESLIKTIQYIPDDVLIIGDAKRGDIGNTSQKYAESVFNYLKCDAVTLNPYMGIDSVQPFLNFKDKLSFILGLTSNKSSADFEKLKLENGKYLYQEVIEKINHWNINNNCGLVFGATNSKELELNIPFFNNLPVLLPGIGAQGGSLKEVVSAFHKYKYKSFLINVGRALIYTDDSQYFGNAVGERIISYNNEIYELLN